MIIERKGKWIVYLFNILYIIFFVFIFIPQYKGLWPIKFPQIFARDVFEVGFISVLVYSLYYILRRYRVNRNITVVVSALLIVILSLVSLSVLYFEIGGFDYRYYEVFVRFAEYVGIAVILGGLLAIADNIYYLLSLFNYNKLKCELEEARKKILKHQFNPHFLFNALNSIYSLSLNNSSKTSEAILKLSSLMRYLTDESDSDVVSLNREVQFIREYIDIEKIRFGSDANITFDIEGEYHNKLIEPFLLITLVENAFKHGFYLKSKDAFIAIKLTTDDGWLNFSIENSISEMTDGDRDGKGLNILRNRLELAYSKRYDLKLKPGKDVYGAELRLKLKD
jgi:sensor histidine kinase YesM